jgi:hypothetical protein
MQQILKRVIQAIACLALVVTIKAADVNGTWTWTSPGRNGGPDRTSTLKLKTEGDKLTGTVSAFRQGAEDTKISDGKVTGDEVSFNVTREFNGNSMTQKYVGKVSGDTIKFKVTGKNRQGEETTREVEAKRKSDDKKDEKK